MKNTLLVKFLSGVGLFALWAALVFLGKADAGSLITAIGAALAGLGVFSAAVNSGVPGPKGDKGDPADAPATDAAAPAAH